MTSFWRHNHVITTSCVQWVVSSPQSKVTATLMKARPETHFKNSSRAHIWKRVRIPLVLVFLRSDQNTILYMSRRVSCRNMCKIFTWSYNNFPSKTKIFFKIWLMSSNTVCVVKWVKCMLNVCRCCVGHSATPAAINTMRPSIFVNNSI